MHAVHFGSPLMAVLAGGIAIARAINPKRFTCRACGYTWK